VGRADALSGIRRVGDRQRRTNVPHRDFALGRGNWTFFGSDTSGKTAAVLRSFIATCKRCGVEPVCLGSVTYSPAYRRTPLPGSVNCFLTTGSRSTPPLQLELRPKHDLRTGLGRGSRDAYGFVFTPTHGSWLNLTGESLQRGPGGISLEVQDGRDRHCLVNKRTIIENGRNTCPSPSCQPQRQAPGAPGWIRALRVGSSVVHLELAGHDCADAESSWPLRRLPFLHTAGELW
jgi:hypothetical protein